MHSLKELIHVVSPDRVDIDDPGKPARAVADETRGENGRKADAQVEPLADCGLALDQAHIGMDLTQSAVTHAPRLLPGVELLADAAPESDLVEARAVANLDREGARANLGEERTRIAFLDGVEPVLMIGDEPREHVEPPRRAFRMGEAGDGRAQLELLDQRHEIDAARLEHGALGEIDLVEFELGKLVAHRGVGTGEEARADGVARQNAGAGEGASRRFRRRVGRGAFGERLEQLVMLHSDCLGIFAELGHCERATFSPGFTRDRSQWQLDCVAERLGYAASLTRGYLTIELT